MSTVESLTTYLRVRICAYSPRTGIRSKCPWAVTLTMEPSHLRRLQDAVGFFFFTTTNRQLPAGTITVGFSFFPTTNQQIPKGTTYAGAFMTQWVFPFLPQQTDVYPRVLHDAFAPIVYGLVYMIQWIFLFYHENIQIPTGTTYTGFIFSRP